MTLDHALTGALGLGVASGLNYALFKWIAAQERKRVTRRAYDPNFENRRAEKIVRDVGTLAVWIVWAAASLISFLTMMIFAIRLYDDEGSLSLWLKLALVFMACMALAHWTDRVLKGARSRSVL